jgi:3-deoxy-D-manno-octulosonate 8-phosphate phosphatase (KDO 8-P phosphatase)
VHLQNESPLSILKNVRIFVFDMDGVFTNNTILVQEDGSLLRTMHVADGLAVKYALARGYEFHVITGGKSIGAVKRLNALGIENVHTGIANKRAVLQQIIQDRHHELSQMCYMGDDIPDIEVMQMVGVPVCPQDAHPDIKKICVFQTNKRGGEGCVRELIELVMRLRGDWPETPLYL